MLATSHQAGCGSACDCKMLPPAPHHTIPVAQAEAAVSALAVGQHLRSVVAEAGCSDPAIAAATAAAAAAVAAVAEKR